MTKTRKKHIDDIAGKLSRGIGLVSKAHKLSYLEELITWYLLFSHIFVIVTMCEETSMCTIQVELFNAETGQQNNYGKIIIYFVGIVDGILTSRVLSIRIWHLEFYLYNFAISR